MSKKHHYLNLLDLIKEGEAMVEIAGSVFLIHKTTQFSRFNAINEMHVTKISTTICTVNAHELLLKAVGTH